MQNLRNDVFSAKTRGVQGSIRSLERLLPWGFLWVFSASAIRAAFEETRTVSVLAKRLPCNAATTAVIAAGCFAATFMWDAAGQSAAAQVRLQAKYIASVGGIPVGRGGWVVDIFEDQYTASATGATSGILTFFTSAKGSSVAHGSFNGGGQPVASSYAATIDYNRHLDDVRMALAGGNVTEFSAEPPLPPHPERIPVSDADRRGVVDPVSSTLNKVSG